LHVVLGVACLVHIWWSWRDSAMGNSVVYLVVGFTAGRLVSIANRCSRQHDEATRNPETLRHGKRQGARRRNFR
jgi:hypothetical protein